jgi:predicted nucleotide-binding protein (sugar kinase/HSP70/actin superfamily)
MTDHVHALAAAFQACGNPAEPTPECDAESVKLGRKFTSGRECYPCILTTGMMVKMIQSRDFDPEKSAFFMPSSNGPCRFGQYFHFQRLLLDELGYNNVPIYSFNQDDAMYQDCAAIGSEFTRLAWQGIVAIDLLEKKARETRPYESTRGETDQVYHHYLNRVTQYVKEKKDLAKLLKQARGDFSDISLERENGKPVIGIVGEIYIRSNRFGNENIVRQIETLGGEVWLPPIGEWFLYINFTALRDSFKHRRYANFLKVLITNLYQRYDEHHLDKTFGPILKNHPEPSTLQTLRYASPYLDSTFEGEAILSIGKAVDFARKGVSGIINVMPFSCMPGTIVNALLKRFREIERNVPVINMSYDGQEQTNTRTRLEAFLYQVRQFQEHKSS